jgi:hypothetical protein
MAAVLDIYSYKLCRLTPDRRHIVPDYVDVVPVKQTQIDRFAEFYKDFREYYQSTSDTINFSAGAKYKGFGISGSYSKTYQTVKKNTITSSTSIMESKVKNHAYSLIAEPDAPLEAVFKQRILEMGDAIRMNKTYLASYLSQLLVRDYGTHVVTRVEAGSVVKGQDYVDKTLVYTMEESISAAQWAAAASFFASVGFHIGGGHSDNKTNMNIQTYAKIVRNSIISAHGGPGLPLLLGSSNDWFNQSLADLIALDRNGDPIYWYITSGAIPELPEPMVETIQQLVSDAVQEYYDQNTVPGCTNPDAPNFKYAANLEDGTCNKSYTNFTFGGLYQTCTVLAGDANGCDGLVVDNGMDGQMYCPNDYSPQPLTSFDYTFPPHPETSCQQVKHWCGWWIFGHTCYKTVCGSANVANKVRIQSFWCNATTRVTQNTGYMFAGIYSDRRPNPFTNQQSCPGHFFPVRLGAGTDSFSVCVSRDYELDVQYQIPFSGFMSCVLPSHVHCHSGYSQHLATRIQGCEINYCIRTGAMKQPGFAQIYRPPFIKNPYDYQAESVIYSYEDGRHWIWNETNALWIAVQNPGAETSQILTNYAAYLNKTAE